MATLNFSPSAYHNTIGSHAPVATIASGDQVITATVDAWGQDARTRRVTPGPNPMTGPFFVKGAKPGDTLAVRIDRITPSRPFGWVRTPLAYNAVDPDHARLLPDRDRALGKFRVDLKAGTVTLVSPKTKLGALILPLNPMIGCFGVAPEDGQAISTATSGAYGGNMDYNGFVAGTTAYFPVFAPGALLHLGDVHARQGDGEISGTGIEISAEVAFTVKLIKRKRIETVRGEDADWIFTVGNARPLDQALQHATSEMSRLLATDYGLDGHEIGILIGQSARYDLGNMFDPAYTMVCKLPRKILAGLR